MEAGANPNVRDTMYSNVGVTPLMLAAKLGYYDVCEYLNHNGADPNQMEYGPPSADSGAQPTPPNVVGAAAGAAVHAENRCVCHSHSAGQVTRRFTTLWQVDSTSSWIYLCRMVPMFQLRALVAAPH